MPRFLVERYIPGDAQRTAVDIEARARAAAEAVTAEGTAITYLGSTVLPEDAACFCLFEAESALDVQQANDRAGLVYLRITRALDNHGSGVGVPQATPAATIPKDLEVGK